jgi:hypothetical protein
MYCPDGSQMRFNGVPGTAMGWLGGAPFQTGASPPAVREKLLELLSEWVWQPAYTCGIYICNLGACEDLVGKPQYEVWKGRKVWFGATNLYIPGSDTVYIAPSTIIHYMSTHEYRPSDSFCDAVLNCPPMSSRAYFEAFGPALQISAAQQQTFSSWVSIEFEAWSEALNYLNSNPKPFPKPVDRQVVRRRIEGFNAVFGANHPLV